MLKKEEENNRFDSNLPERKNTWEVIQRFQICFLQSSVWTLDDQLVQLVTSPYSLKARNGVKPKQIGGKSA